MQAAKNAIQKYKIFYLAIKKINSKEIKLELSSQNPKTISKIIIIQPKQHSKIIIKMTKGLLFALNVKKKDTCLDNVCKVKYNLLRSK